MAKVKGILLKNYKVIVFVLCIIFFLMIAENVFEKEIMRADIVGYNFVSEYLINDSITPFVKIITNFGGPLYLLIIAAVLFLFIKNKKIGIFIVSNLIIVAALNQALKFILQRPRPTEFRIIDETGYSFPSGHSMVSMAFYGYLIYLIYKYIKSKFTKRLLIVFLSCLIVMIGVSRIYLGVHYTSDVAAGFVVSVAYLILYIKITNIILYGRADDEN